MHHSLTRSEKSKRLMLGKEQLAALGYPCNPKGAAAARVDSWPTIFSRKKHEKNNVWICLEILWIGSS